MEGHIQTDNFLSLQPLQTSKAEAMKNFSGQQGQMNSDKSDVSLKEASRNFESIFLNYMIKAMWKTIPDYSTFGGGSSGMKGYTSIMQNALAEDLAQKGGLGFAPIIYNQLKMLNGSQGAQESYNKPQLTVDKNIGNEFEKNQEDTSSIDFSG